MLKKKCLLLGLALLLSGCQGNDAEPEKPVRNFSLIPPPVELPVLEPEAEPEPEIDLTGLALNPLTGLYIDEAAAQRRPFAVVINNLPKALPQSGIGQADMIYEVLAEGGITRMIAIFKDFDAEKIGPVRSTRHYFLDFALDHDAVFAHHGGSPQGYSAVSNLGVQNLDGMALEGRTFFRDQARFNTPGMYEHSSYTSAERLLAEVENKGFRGELKEEYQQPFDFLEPEEAVEGKPALKITVPYAPQSQVGVFEYDEVTNSYLRYQNGKAHIDELTGEQLQVHNVLVQYTTIYVISGDDAGRREVQLVNSGDGVLFTGGVSIPVKWSKSSHQSPTEWSTTNGERLKLNKGKTWVCVFQSNSDIIIESTDQIEEPEEPAEE